MRPWPDHHTSPGPDSSRVGARAYAPLLGGVVGVGDVDRDPAARRHLVAVRTRPFTDLRGVRRSRRTAPALARLRGRGAARVLRPFTELLAQQLRVLRGQVDFVGLAVVPERDRLRGFLTVDVVDHLHDNFLRHAALFLTIMTRGSLNLKCTLHQSARSSTVMLGIAPTAPFSSASVVCTYC